MLLTESVTQMLKQWSRGDKSALEKLMPIIYDELRRQAAIYLQRERDEQTLQATALVHEAFIDILPLKHIDWKSRAHFINMMALTMRRILVQHARKRKAIKRDFRLKVPLSQAENVTREPQLDLVVLDEALQNFAKEYPRQHSVVELKFFGGLDTEEISQVMQAMGVHTSPRTVERDWTFARAWLHGALIND